MTIDREAQVPADSAGRLGTLDGVLAAAASVAGGLVAQQAASVDRDARWPHDGIRALQAAGLGGLVVPAEAGGLGHGLLALARACETLGSSCASTAIAFGMHCVGAAVMSARPTPDQRERYLEPICRGEHLTTLSLSEPGTGSHFYIPQTRLVSASADALVATGTKSFVTNGGHADSYVVSGVSVNDAGAGDEFSCFVLPGDAPGIEWGASWDGIGMRGNSARTMELRGVSVPRRDLLGREGDQIWYVFQVVAPYFLMAMAGTYLGVAAAALEEARLHLIQRRHAHTGVALARQPVLQHRFGALWAELERARRLVHHAAVLADADDPGALPAVLSAKAEVADAAVRVVNESMTLAGGIAYREGGRMERHLRDVRAAHVMAPTTDLLRIWAGRALLEQPLLGD